LSFLPNRDPSHPASTGPARRRETRRRRRRRRRECRCKEKSGGSMDDGVRV